MLQVKEISKTYKLNGSSDNDVLALRNISLSFNDSGLVFIVGKSGCGKSTLLNILGGLDKPDTGELIINGKSSRDFKNADYDSYRNTYIGFVFQEYNLIDNYTVEENVSLAISLQGKKRSDGLIESCLKKVDMSECAKRKTNQLSGGQKQRIAIARALVKNPKIILADEPTGALDSETGTQIMKLLKELSKDRLVIVVSHDLQYAKKYADRIIKIKDGQVVDDSDRFEYKIDNINNSTMIRSRLRFFDSLKMAFHSLRCKISRLALTMLLATVAFSAFGVISAFTSWNKIDAVVKTIDDSLNKEVSLKNVNDSTYASTIFSQDKVNQIKERFDGKVFLKEIVGSSPFDERIGVISIVSRGDKNPYLPGTAFSKAYENLDVYGYSCFDDVDISKAGFSLEGRLPKNSDEISISRIHYESLKKANGLTTYEGLVVNINVNYSSNNEYKVVGVVDNHFDTKKYANVSESALSKDENLSKRLESDIRNSFTGIVYLNKTVFDNAKANEKSTLAYLNDGVYEEIDVDSVYSNLEMLYLDYLNKKEELWCRDNNDYYDWQDNKINYTTRWFSENGYTLDANDSRKYSKTINDETGEYEVIYEYQASNGCWRRTTDKEDGTLMWPEKPPIDISRNVFVQKQFVNGTKYNVDSLLNSDGTFREIDDDMLVLGVDSQTSNLYDQFVHGELEINIFENIKDIKLDKVNYLYLMRDVESSEAYTSSSLAVSKTNKKVVEDNCKGFWRINAVLTSNHSINHDFVSYCFQIDKSNSRIEVQNVSTNLVSSIDSFIKGKILKICIAIAIAFAVFSSLILMNFLFISMSYNKKEIGILRGLGARNADVLGIFAKEGILISLINGALASIITLIACQIINNEFAKSIGVNLAILNYSFIQPLLIFGCCIVSSFVACSAPILKNLNKKPVETINGR